MSGKSSAERPARKAASLLWYITVFVLAAVLISLSGALAVLIAGHRAENAAVETIPAVTSVGIDPAPDRSTLLNLISQARAQRGLPGLATSAELAQAAQEFSQMVAQADSPSALSGVDPRAALHALGYYPGRLWRSVFSGSQSPQAIFDYSMADAQTQAEFLSADVADGGLGCAVSPSSTDYCVIMLSAEERLTAPGTNIHRPGGASQTQQAVEILRLLNAARGAKGLGLLTIDGQLMMAALAHSQDMAGRDLMTHDGADGSQPVDRVVAAGYRPTTVGENVLERDNMNASGAFDQWWNSPHHYENMMSPDFTDIGIAYSVSSAGQYYYTMDLAR